MVQSKARNLADYLHDQFEDDLRSVGFYDGDESEFIFVRDDVGSTYENGDFDRVFRENRLEALDRPHQESLYAHGELLATVRFFEEASELHFVLSDTEGIVAALDAGATGDLRGLITDCADAISQ